MAAMHAWFDISAGVAGDMVLGALLDAGADVGALQAALDAVVPGAVRLDTEEVTRGGQRATKARVRVLVDDPAHRTWASIRAMLAEADLADETRARALAAFGRLAEAEGRTHGVDPDTVHFHEVGALDSIADVVGACEALRLLGVTSVSASAVRVGSGRVRAAHGDIPVPVPAVAELVLGWQVHPTPERAGAHHHDHDDHHGHGHPHDHLHEHPHDHHHHTHDTPAAVTTPGSVGELATPTGMALVRALAGDRCEALPGLTVRGLGVGAGGKDTVGWPNVVRVVLGGTAADSPATGLAELRANVDDLDPRLWPGVLDTLLAAGAADAWLVPIQMKKGRPAFTLHALADADHHDAVTDAILTRTSTLGVRWTPVTRTVLDRSWTTVDVDGQAVRVKVGSRDGVVLHATPEFADVAAAALALGRPEADVLGRAQAAAAASGVVPGACNA
ncbi:LarC family nickel insertion protein [Propioniciclava sp. MC1595]|nr:LarC family nickel insertion protein [Propioniciclava sp. MC1595]